MWRREGLKDGDKSGARPPLAFGLIPEGVAANSVSFPDIPGLYSSPAPLPLLGHKSLHCMIMRERDSQWREREREGLSSASPDYFGMKAGLCVFWGGLLQPSLRWTGRRGVKLPSKSKETCQLASVFAHGRAAAHPICNGEERNEFRTRRLHLSSRFKGKALQHPLIRGATFKTCFPRLWEVTFA